MNKQEMKNKLIDQLEMYHSEIFDYYNSMENINIKNNMLAIVVYAYQCKIINDSEMNDLRRKYKL